MSTNFVGHFPARSADEYRDLDTDTGRNWAADFNNVIRWFKCHGYHELASGLNVKRVEVLSIVPTIDEEAEAAEGALAYLYDRLGQPPGDISVVLAKEIRTLIHTAIKSTRARSRIILPEYRERQRAAIGAVAARLHLARTQLAKSSADIPPGAKDCEWLVEGPFDLKLNTNNHVITRGSKTADFGRHNNAWAVLLKLVERHPHRYLARDIGHDVWNPQSKDVDACDNQVQREIVTIRKLLVPLQVEVDQTRGIGYVLVEGRRASSSTNSMQKTKRRASRRKKKPSRG